MSVPAQKIPFLSKIDPKGKNVEIWMNEVESGMKAAFKKVLWDSIVEYSEIARPDWIQKYPGQAVLNGSQLHWTKEIEAGVKASGLQGVKDVRACLGVGGCFPVGGVLFPVSEAWVGGAAVCPTLTLCHGWHHGPPRLPHRCGCRTTKSSWASWRTW